MQWFSTFTLTDLSLCPSAVFIPAYIIGYKKIERASRYSGWGSLTTLFGFIWLAYQEPFFAYLSFVNLTKRGTPPLDSTSCIPVTVIVSYALLWLRVCFPRRRSKINAWLYRRNKQPFPRRPQADTSKHSGRHLSIVFQLEARGYVFSLPIIIPNNFSHYLLRCWFVLSPTPSKFFPIKVAGCSYTHYNFHRSPTE